MIGPIRFLRDLKLEARHATFEETHPWLVYSYLSTDLRTRFTGRSILTGTCAICGKSETFRMRIPRWGDEKRIPENDGERDDQGRHPFRVAFIAEHKHPDRALDPQSWSKPLLNPETLPHGTLEEILRNVAQTARMEHEERKRGGRDAQS